MIKWSNYQIFKSSNDQMIKCSNDQIDQNIKFFEHSFKRFFFNTIVVCWQNCNNPSYLPLLQADVLMSNSSLSSEALSDHLWTGAFSVIMVISIMGNTLVLWTVLGDTSNYPFFKIKYHQKLNFSFLSIPEVGEKQWAYLEEEERKKESQC